MNFITRDIIPDYETVAPFLEQYKPTNGKTGKLLLIEPGSLLLAKAAIMGWDVSAIAQNDNPYMESLESFCRREHLKYGCFIKANKDTFDCSTLADHYDVIISSGFLIQTPNTTDFIKRWSKVVREGGIILSMCPNCNSINGKIFKMFSPDEWNMLVPFSRQSFDRIHCEAGLRIKIPAYYSRGIDIHMLIPWDKISYKCRSTVIYRLIKYTATFLEKILNPFVKKNNETFNSFLYGVYEK